MVGRAKAFEAIVKGTEIPESTVPESFKVLVKELNGLGLKVELLGAQVTKKETDSKEEKVQEKEKESAKDQKKESIVSENKVLEVKADKIRETVEKNK